MIASQPAVGVAMRVAGSAYLLYLAVSIARSGAFREVQVARPLGVAQAAASS